MQMGTPLYFCKQQKDMPVFVKSIQTIEILKVSVSIMVVNTTGFLSNAWVLMPTDSIAIHGTCINHLLTGRGGGGNSRNLGVSGGSTLR